VPPGGTVTRYRFRVNISCAAPGTHALAWKAMITATENPDAGNAPLMADTLYSMPRGRSAGGGNDDHAQARNDSGERTRSAD
jgi:hypothetical protein